jgi:protein TonB
MKRNEKKVPEFDEIIFENRNKNYGAYDLRKSYKTTTSLSILGGVTIFAILTLAISFTPEEGKASAGPTIVTIEVSNAIMPEKVPPPELKPPAEMINQIKNLQPVVTVDSSETSSYIPTTEEVAASAENGSVPEEVIPLENPEPLVPAENKPFIRVEEMPEFPGGWQALLKYIGQNIRYPSEAQNNNIQGKVILQFVVNSDGSVDRIEVLRSVHPSLDSEAVRVVKTLPRFKPGKQGGIPVPVWYSLPVTFRLENK